MKIEGNQKELDAMVERHDNTILCKLFSTG